MKKGTAPFLNCSTRGFRPFSSLIAKLDGISIDRLVKQSNRDNYFIVSLWRKYIAKNPNLTEVLLKASGLSDPFATPGQLSVADALWQIRAELLETPQISTTETTEKILTESKISDMDSEITMFPGLKLKEISVMVSSKKVTNFNSIAFSYSVTAEAEPNINFLAAIEHIKAQLLAKVELDHANANTSIKSHPKSTSSLGHIN